MKAEIILIFGKRGSGKTTLMKKLIEDQTRLIIYDPMWEYSDATLKIFQNQMDLIKFLKKRGDTLFRIVYQPQQPTQEFNFVCQLVYCLYDVIFACEEIDLGTSHNYTPPPLERIICQGRHKGISLYATTRRPPEVPKLLTSQANKLYVFKMHEPKDLAYFKEIMGDQAEKIKELKPYQYLFYDVDNGEIKIS